MVSLGISEERLETVRKLMAGVPNGTEKAIAKALNYVARGIPYDFAKAARERYMLPSSEHMKLMKQVKVISASPKNLVATIIACSPRIEVADFSHHPYNPPSQKSMPVYLRKKITTTIVAGQTKGWSHAFLARMKSGHLGLWTRSETEKTSKGKAVIHEYFTLSQPQMYAAEPVLNYAIEKARESLDREIDIQMQVVLRDFRRDADMKIADILRSGKY